MAKTIVHTTRHIPGTGSATGGAPAKQVPVAPNANAPGRFGIAPPKGGGSKGGMKGGGGSKRGR